MSASKRLRVLFLLARLAVTLLGSEVVAYTLLLLS
jgi:hypothetical protein